MYENNVNSSAGDAQRAVRVLMRRFDMTYAQAEYFLKTGSKGMDPVEAPYAIRDFDRSWEKLQEEEGDYTPLDGYDA